MPPITGFLGFVLHWKGYPELFVPLARWGLRNLLNKEYRISYIFQPRLFDFQIYTELRFQLQHFLTESRYSIGKVEAGIDWFKSRQLDLSLEAATNTFEEFRQRNERERERKRSYTFQLIHHILPGRHFDSPEEIQLLNKYYDPSTQILQRLKDLKTTLAVYNTSLVNMEWQHNHLLAIMASAPGFALGRNPSPAQLEDGLTSDSINSDYDLDTVFSPSDLAALRQGVAQVYMEKTNVNIVSGILYTTCILWRHFASRSEFDEYLLGPMQRSWTLEQNRAGFEHRKLMGYDDDSISENLVKLYREYQEVQEAPAFIWSTLRPLQGREEVWELKRRMSLRGINH